VNKLYIHLYINIKQNKSKTFICVFLLVGITNTNTALHWAKPSASVSPKRHVHTHRTPKTTHTHESNHTWENTHELTKSKSNTWMYYIIYFIIFENVLKASRMQRIAHHESTNQ